MSVRSLLEKTQRMRFVRTPLMQRVPRVGLDSPVNALIREEVGGKTSIACDDPQNAVCRFGLEVALAANLAAVVPLIERAAAE